MSIEEAKTIIEEANKEKIERLKSVGAQIESLLKDNSMTFISTMMVNGAPVKLYNSDGTEAQLLVQLSELEPANSE